MRRAVPFIKAVVGGPAPIAVTDVPFAHAHRRVAGIREHIAQPPIPTYDSRVSSRHRDRVIAAANGVTAGKQRRTRWCALRLGRIVEQLKALGGELIDATRVGAAQDAAAVTAQLAIAQVVYVEVNDVGSIRHSSFLLASCCRSSRHTRLSRVVQIEVYAPNSHVGKLVI